ncbi:MAG: molybdopterin-synthase adenylyltransferase MoeB [Gammaproteobacteria bacterium]|nr:molybdopterin-synthase adenylyltransferase MoeB [Gammaproteobacteria bacterium]MYF27945.1 molybdopterin-synthase adenylyltransferase MoeB [Gammaproteobacteria bacterium]MYK44946.1 molybdopterin-synthase adenylyltransferase MoeB [Gammaproteobacteria bacterium]
MNDEALLRYSRQIMLPEFDVAGQQALLDAHVLVVGLGGLGSPSALYLAAAGVGSLTLVDHDTVDVSNLQRQIIHDQASVGVAKVDSAAARIASLSPATRLETIAARLDGPELDAVVGGADVVLDGTDNFTARYAINAACVRAKTPLVSGAAIRLEGQVTVIDPRREDAPCYRCLYGDAGDEALNCAENGVAAPLVGIIGSVQAMEAMKIIAGVGESLDGYVLHLDAKRMEWRKFTLTKDPDCQTCGGS